MDLASRSDLDRLHQCEDATRGWVFPDTSPRRNCRSCVARACGDRNRSRAYYARKKEQNRPSESERNRTPGPRPLRRPAALNQRPRKAELGTGCRWIFPAWRLPECMARVTPMRTMSSPANCRAAGC